MKILLGSSSPRRRELLHNLGFDFETVELECEEHYPKDLDAHLVAAYLSELKARSFRDLFDDEILITADTVVAVDGSILGKPAGFEDAKKMLQQISGRSHEVHTAFSIRTASSIHTVSDVAKVQLAFITDYECDYYLKNCQPYDKAGSYGIQEWLGMAKITKITGNFYTIMGLPTHLLYENLKDLHKK